MDFIQANEDKLIELTGNPNVVKIIEEGLNQSLKNDLKMSKIVYKVLIESLEPSDEAIDKMMCDLRGNRKVAFRLALDEAKGGLSENGN